MKRALLYIAGGIVALVAIAAGVLGVMISGQPDAIEVERSALIDATTQDIHPLLNDFKAFVQWSPWSERDPNQVSEFSDPSSGVGAWYTWSGNDDVGTGRMEIVAATPLRVDQKLSFITPMEAEADVALVMAEEGEQTRVTWSMHQPADFPTKVFTVFVDMDAMLGADFEAGLHALGELALAAKAERLAAEQAAAQAAAEIAAQATAGEGDEAVVP